MKKLNSYIKNCLTSLLLIVGIFTGMQTAQAQQYPVQGFLSIIPPYPAQLADYANPNINRLNLTLTLNDISVNNKRVRLKVFVLRQNSLFTQTSGNYFGDVPVILTSGIPEQLTSNELAGYFKLQNLQGIVPDSYAQPLGEGFMNIYFVVYDYFTGRQLSNKIEFPFFILLNDPPLLNLPLNGAHISNAGAIAPQIAFSWTSRATQASNTDYVFTLAPIYDPSGDPFTQFLASIPVYQTTISNQTNLLYGFAEPPLLPGKTYGWRVQAKAKSGFEDVGLYKQNGFSEIHTFTYDNPCLPIADQDVTVEARASDRLYVQWQAPTDAGQQLAGGYMVAYRKYSAGGMWNWQEQTTQTPNYYITGLEPTTDYEVKVARTCTDGTYTYTNPQKATTLAVNQLPVKIDCGKVPSIDISNQNPLPQLNSGDVVMAGDFPVTILRANSAAGRFSGEGWVKVPYLADTKIHVTYQNIKVNTDYKLIDGYFETVYNAKSGNIASVDTLFADVKNLVIKIADIITKRNSFLNSYKGSDLDKQSASERQKEEDAAFNELGKSPYLTQAQKDTLQQEQKAVDDAYAGMAGKPCNCDTSKIGTGTSKIKGPAIVFYDAIPCPEELASESHLQLYANINSANAIAAFNLRVGNISKFFPDDKEFNFITITGKKITLPKNCTVSFSYGIDNVDEIANPIGYLYNFNINEDSDNKQVHDTYTSTSDDKGVFIGYFDANNVEYVDKKTANNTDNNIITLLPQQDGIYLAKVSATLPPYVKNEPELTFDNFPIQPISTSALKLSDLIKYDNIGGLLKHQNEDYTLQKEFIAKAIYGHENTPQYIYALKMAELRTAYRNLFTKFTDIDCYEKWNADLSKTITAIPGKYDNGIRIFDCSGIWEQSMRDDKSIYPLITSDPVNYYKRFANGFINYITNQDAIKTNFLDKLSLNTTQAEASAFITNCSNAELTALKWTQRDILLRVMARLPLLVVDDEQNVVKLVQYMPESQQSSLLNALVVEKDADNQALLIKRFIGYTIDDLNGDDFYNFINIVDGYARHVYTNISFLNDDHTKAYNKNHNQYGQINPSFLNYTGVLINSGFLVTKYSIITEDGKIILSGETHNITIGPYESVTILFTDDKSTDKINIKKGTFYTISAIKAYAMLSAITTNNLKILGKATLDIALIATGVGELDAAFSVGTILGGTDIAFGTANLLIDAKYRDVLSQDDDGKKILEFWDYANTVYVVGRLPAGLIDAQLVAKARQATASVNTIVKGSAITSGEKAILLETATEANAVLANAGATGFDLPSFISKPLSEKIAAINDIWKTKYPIEEMLGGRSFFEDMMGEYRYTKATGWEHTGDIAPNFKGVDFYKGTTQGNQIFAETAVSMKTTITTDVDAWLASKPIKDNIGFLEDGLDPKIGLLSNQKKMSIINAEIHVYMPKVNITDGLKNNWLNKLNTINPKIKFEINAIEDFIK